MFYEKIKIELEKRKITVKAFCQQIGVSEQSLHQMIRNKSMKVDILERISEALNVPVSYWFDNESIANVPLASAKNEPVSAKRIDNVTLELNKVLKALMPK